MPVVEVIVEVDHGIREKGGSLHDYNWVILYSKIIGELRVPVRRGRYDGREHLYLGLGKVGALHFQSRGKAGLPDELARQVLHPLAIRQSWKREDCSRLR